MARFYISSTLQEDDVRLCEESRNRRKRITITGATESGELKSFRGIVQSVEEFHNTVPSRRWRVTILED